MWDRTEEIDGGSKPGYETGMTDSNNTEIVETHLRSGGWSVYLGDADTRRA